MQTKSWLTVAAAIILITAGLGGFKAMEISAAIAAASAMPEQQETVEATTVRAGTWVRSARAVGTSVALRHVELRNEVPGTVVEVGFSSGEIVQPGQLLVRFDTASEQADLAAARADAELARLTLERRQRLVRSEAAATADLDQARANLSAARARVAMAEATISKKNLKAPFMARVGIRDLQPGAYLSEGTLIAALQGVGPDTYVDFSLAQDNAIGLGIGSEVRISGTALSAGGETGRIIATDSSVDNSSRTVRFRALLPGQGDRVPPGSFLDVQAGLGSPQPVLLLPLTAIRRAPFGDHVFVIVADGEKLRAQQRFVRLGPVDGDDVVVMDGVRQGDRVAAAGSFKLRDGLAIQVQDVQAQSVPASSSAATAATSR
jgi:membrane fusion protein, multidrug efflux system